jgi:predicted transcriptional regulator of viral defense system/very-short-patch-repair endonuclease
MSDARNYERSRQAWELAGRQHGVVARRQLLALGFSKRAIEHRVARGRLHRVMPGVYAVGWPQLTRERRWMTAVLAGGEGAVLSHRSAASLWEVATENPGTTDISVPRHTALSRAGIRVRSRPALRALEVVSRRGIPVTDIVRTLIDLAPNSGLAVVERAINEADKRNLISPDTLRLRLVDHAGEAGVRPLRQLLDKHTFRLSDSDLEVLFRPIAEAAGLPIPLTKQIVNGFEVDFFWTDLGLVVETDGLRYHRTPSTQARDARRDRTHVLAGTTPLRFTHYEIKHESHLVREVLERAARLLRERKQL